MADTLIPLALRRCEGGWELAYSINGHRRGITFSEVSQAREWLKNPSAGDDAEEQLLRYAVRAWIARDGTLTNFNTALRNKTLTLDPAAANMLSIV